MAKRKNDNFSIKCPCCGSHDNIELRIEKANTDSFMNFEQRPEGYKYIIFLLCNRDGCGRTTTIGYLKDKDGILLSKEHPFMQALFVERVTKGLVTRPVKSKLPLY